MNEADRFTLKLAAYAILFVCLPLAVIGGLLTAFVDEGAVNMVIGAGFAGLVIAGLAVLAVRYL